MAKDYYATLGVDRDASQDEIKRSFRRLARESHPDANPDDPTAEERFREIAEAYEVLSDPERRRRYDRGDTIDLGDLFAGFGGFDDLLRSVFGDLSGFGAGTRPGSPQRGRDVLARVEVDLEQAAFGTTVDVSFRTNIVCTVCSGDGAKPGSDRSICPTCSGSGAVRAARRGLLGTVMSVTTCTTCAGSGEVYDEVCERCVGAGVTAEDRTVKVEVPPGVTTGTRLRLSREGEAVPRGGQAGDLFVETVVRPDPRFERAGDDLIHRATVGVAEAALGTTLSVPTIDGGRTSVDVPAGMQPGWNTRVTGEGMSRLGRRGRGDLLVAVDVEVPTDLSVEEEELLRRFAELRNESPNAPGRRRRRR